MGSTAREFDRELKEGYSRGMTTHLSKTDQAIINEWVLDVDNWERVCPLLSESGEIMAMAHEEGPYAGKKTGTAKLAEYTARNAGRTI